MRTRREQMQAYRFVIRRIVASVLSGEPETLDRPMRRLGISLFVSAMIAVLVFAGFGVYGLLTNPPSDPDEAGELIVVREDATIFVAQNGLLHPVPNLASGRLILGDVQIRRVSKDSLEDMPRGVPLGIPGAPFELPDSDDLLGLPWRVCSVPPGVGETAPTTTVVIDNSLGGDSSQVGQQALFVASGDEHYLLWNDLRLLVPDPDAAQVALQLTTDPPVVDKSLINTISRGPDLRPPRVPGAGQPSEHLPDAEVGDLVTDGGQHYLVTEDGLGLVYDVTVELLRATGVEARQISTAQAIELDREPVEPESFPETVPREAPTTGDPTICTAYDGEYERPLGTRIEVFESAPQELATSAGAIPLTQTSLDPAPIAHQAVIAGGRGALVKEIPQAGQEPQEGDTTYLITDQGNRFPIVGESVEALGYGDVEPVGIPADLLALLPLGPTLSQEAAMKALQLAPAQSSG